jgi:5-methylcytosine-specific restriction endonuclease McrA
MPMPRKEEPEKYCEFCGQRMHRNTYATGRLEDLAVFKRRKFCSLHCANQRKRPKHWETYHYRARKHRKQLCETCGSTTDLHAHHVDGRPENNSPENIQTLCVYCHNFLHATAERRGWEQPGRLPAIRGMGNGSLTFRAQPAGFPAGWTDLEL